MKNLNVFLLGMSVLALTACGTQSTRDSSGTNTTSGNSTTTVTATPTPTATPQNVNNLPAAYQTAVQLSGNGGSNPSYTVSSLTTSRTLKVKVTPLAAPQIPGTAWVFPYGCLSVQVTVDGSTQQTNPIPVGTASSGVSPQCSGNNYAVLDFSNVMTGDNLGGGRVSVSVHDADYDNCRSYYSPYYYGCYMIALYKTHMAALNLTIETDGTYDSQINGH